MTIQRIGQQARKSAIELSWWSDSMREDEVNIVPSEVQSQRRSGRRTNHYQNLPSVGQVRINIRIW